MKKAIAAVSCLLVSMAVFSKGFVLEHLTKSKQQYFVKEAKNMPDFTGFWVGPCNILQEKLALNIVQTDKNIILADEDGEDALKFPISQVKSKVVSSIDGTQHSLSSAFYTGGNSIDLFFYSMGNGASDHTTFSFSSSYEVSLELDNGKLKFIVDQYPEDIVCVLDKQG
ncbi:hypothetical protein Lgee_0522 [Legionella geestiana]|uniref:Uncharacterized protein n=1 Tax=Legionella geestiana TaxID=45065 RepID=A0A0W0U7R1_9GAMM|nr:hypothetical protein [Legionella geestiana]KTD03709.1 hypothetical protein Lgee_0522 [Legionella geestiana]QBS11524.1 hypothetical protein E4T54_01515 [Legionella geestiana]STX53811.1 Uncharacterised protein [Legionella geestiana]